MFRFLFITAFLVFYPFHLLGEIGIIAPDNTEYELVKHFVGGRFVNVDLVRKKGTDELYILKTFHDNAQSGFVNHSMRGYDRSQRLQDGSASARLFAITYQTGKFETGKGPRDCALTEYIDGENLIDFFKARPTLAEASGRSDYFERLYLVVTDIVTGVSHAMKHGVLLGDLHEENIRVSSTRAVFVDFDGISSTRLFSPPPTVIRSRIPPEYSRFYKTAVSDFYVVGLTLKENIETYLLDVLRESGLERQDANRIQSILAFINAATTEHPVLRYKELRKWNQEYQVLGSDFAFRLRFHPTLTSLFLFHAGNICRGMKYLISL